MYLPSYLPAYLPRVQQEKHVRVVVVVGVSNPETTYDVQMLLFVGKGV